MKMQTDYQLLKVGDFMSSPVITVHPDTRFSDAVQTMLLKGIGNIVVMEGANVTGILTEREMLLHLALNKAIPDKQIKYVSTQKIAKVTPDTDVLEAAKTMISKKARLLVFQKDRRTGISDQLIGIITASDIVRALLKSKSNPRIEGAMANKIVALQPNSTILNAVKIMLKKGIGSVIVSANGSPYAIFTERDLLNRVLGENVDIEEKIGDYCTCPIITAKLGIGAKEAGKLMLRHKIKRLPLTRYGKIIAMVTARDLVEAYVREQ
jgi:CBS domain-containing protein